MSIFDEQYRVIGVDGDRLHVRGVQSGEVLTIINSQPDGHIDPQQCFIGALLVLTDPSTASAN